MTERIRKWKLIYMSQTINLTHVEPTSDSVDYWPQHVKEKSGTSLVNKLDSWMTGINSNVPGKNTRIVDGRYGGSVQSYRSLCDRIAKEEDRAMSFS